MDKLRVNGISKKIGNDQILKKVSLTLKDGEIKVILGASGSGKTTILNSIAGIIRPDEGSIVKGGIDITDLEVEKRNIGFVFQDLGLFYSMNVAENIAYGLRIRTNDIDEINKRINEISRTLSIESYLHKFPAQLSGGEKQLVSLARTLVTDPDLVLMDEPLSSLDSFLRNSMRWYIKDIQKKFNVSIIYVTHDLADAEILADSIAILDQGSILDDGEKETVLNHPRTAGIARILGYNLFKMDGREYAIHPSRIEIGGPTKIKILYKERGIKNNYLLETEFGRISLISDQPLVETDGISLKNALLMS
ncbi:MAG: ABC transporter ATP-binding protein [Thermoplasmatales archaeon]